MGKETEAEMRKEEYRLRRRYSKDVNTRAQTWEEQTREGVPNQDRATDLQRHRERQHFYGHFALRPFYNPLFIRFDFLKKD